jgi:glycine cleavage system regulatory protein
VCELARGSGSRSGGLPSLVKPGELKLQPENEIEGSFYIRFIVKDRAGIVGDIGQTFGHLGVNISEIWQLKHSDDECRSLIHSYHLHASPSEILPFVITLEHASLGQVRQALDYVRSRDYIVVDPVWFPIWGTK